MTVITSKPSFSMAAPVQLLRADPDLGSTLAPKEFEYLAARLRLEVAEVPAGEWKAPWTPEDVEREPLVGLLVLEGLIIRTVIVEPAEATAAGERSQGVELLGQGDLLRPWQEDDGELVSARATWEAAGLTRLALIDERVMRVGARWPALGTALFDRLERRSRWATVVTALSSAGTAPERLVLVFDHLGDRWGQVTPRGVCIPLDLTHQLLARLAGMTRPTCSTALSWLTQEEIVGRQPDGGWWLRPDAHAALTEGLRRERS